MDKSKALADKLSRFKGIIFDFDGTLADLNCRWSDLKEKLSAHCLKKQGLSVAFTPLNRKLLDLRDEFGAEFYDELIGIVAEFETEESRYVPHYELLDFINSSSQKIAIYSMNNRDTILNFCKKNLKKIPDIIIGRENCRELKPSGADIEYILKQWGLGKEDVAFVGNAEDDRSSGEAAGITTYII